MTDTYQSPGERLKEERERRKLTERDAANQLHLSMNYLRALEADDYDRLPEPTFVKGYLRNYARLLGLPAEELVAGFEALRTPQQLMQEMPEPVAPTTSRRKAVTTIVCVAVLVLIIGWWLSARESTERVDAEEVAENHLPPAAPAPTANLAGAPASAPLDVSGQAGAPAMSPASAPAAVMPLAPAPQPVANKSAMLAPSQASAAPPAAVAKPSVLLVKFSAPCWVEVADASGQALYKGDRIAGSQLQLRGTAPFRLIFGNAAGVASVSVDGKAVALPHAPAGDVAHLQAP